MLVRANAAREAARVAEQEEAARAVEEAAAQESVAREATRAEELAEEEALWAAAREKMARDWRRWDKDMAAARRVHEIHECRHRLRLARCHGHQPARPTARDQTLSTSATPAGATPPCRRLQAKDRGDCE
jgi:hypothetical protein